MGITREIDEYRYGKNKEKMKHLSERTQEFLKKLWEKDGEVVTHNGTFHADDVFSCALISIVAENVFGMEKIKIIRTNEDEKTDCITFDRGGGKYDHHQRDAKVRENGIKYASFGLLWRDLGCLFFDREGAEEFDQKFIQPLDQSDNFGTYNEIAELISDCGPDWDAPDAKQGGSNEDFFHAFGLARGILIRKFKKLDAQRRAIENIRNCHDKEELQNPILVLKTGAPFQKALSKEKVQFVVYASSRINEWNAQAVKDDSQTPKNKCDFPAIWGGLRNEELQKESGIKGLLFCHSSLFLVAANSKEAAIEACMAALKNKN